MPTSEQIRINSAKGSERVLTSIRPVTYVTANPVEYVTIRMDGEEMTN